MNLQRSIFIEPAGLWSQLAAIQIPNPEAEARQTLNSNPIVLSRPGGAGKLLIPLRVISAAFMQTALKVYRGFKID